MSIDFIKYWPQCIGLISDVLVLFLYEIFSTICLEIKHICKTWYFSTPVCIHELLTRWERADLTIDFEPWLVISRPLALSRNKVLEKTRDPAYIFGHNFLLWLIVLVKVNSLPGCTKSWMDRRSLSYFQVSCRLRGSEIWVGLLMMRKGTLQIISQNIWLWAWRLNSQTIRSLLQICH